MVWITVLYVLTNVCAIGKNMFLRGIPPADGELARQVLFPHCALAAGLATVKHRKLPGRRQGTRSTESSLLLRAANHPHLCASHSKQAAAVSTYTYSFKHTVQDRQQRQS